MADGLAETGCIVLPTRRLQDSRKKALDFRPQIVDTFHRSYGLLALIYSPLDQPKGLLRGFALIRPWYGQRSGHAC